MTPRKAYYDDTLAKAIKRVKIDMGPSAVILSTKQITKDGRSMFEVVATNDHTGIPALFDKPSSPKKAKSPKKTGMAPPSVGLADKDRRELVSSLVNAYRKGKEGKKGSGLSTKNPLSALNGLKNFPNGGRGQNIDNNPRPKSIEENTAPMAGNAAIDIEKKIEDIISEKFLNKIDAIEQSFKHFESKVSPILEGANSSNHYLLPQNFARYIPILTDQGIPEAFSSRLMDLCFRALRNQPQIRDCDIRNWLLDSLKKKISIFKPPKISGQRVMVFAGPTGAGKTTTIAKLAARASLERKMKVALVSMDTFRIGAIHQLRKYADLIGVHFETAMTIDGVKDIIKKLHDYDRIFIDTRGCNFINSEEAQRFSNEFSSFRNESFLVLSACSDLKTNERIIRNFEKSGYDQLIFSKLDETVRHGGLWCLSMKSKKPLSYLTDGQRVPEDIKSASVEYLFNLVLPKNGGKQD